MGVTSLQHFATAFLWVVASAAARSLLLAVVAGVSLAFLRLRNVSLRLAIWKAVLWSALVMPIVAWVMPPMPVVLSGAVGSQLARFGLTDQNTVQSGSENSLAGSAVARVNRLSPQFVQARTTHEEASGRHATKVATSLSAPAVNNRADSDVAEHRSISGARIALEVYFAMVVLLLSRFFIGWTLGRRLIRFSRPIRDSRALLSLSLRAFPGGMKEAPVLAESEAVTVPVTLGVMRPLILLPADWREWEIDKLNAVLAHELSHIGRHDALMQRLSKLHRAIYWFSPMAWWLDRELARLAEEASDEAALASGADRERYAETLLRFFEAIRAASGRVRWQGVSMAAGGDAARRVDRILSWKGAVTMRLRKSFVVALAAIALPLLIAAASVHFTVRASQRPPVPSAAPVPAAPPQASGATPPSSLVYPQAQPSPAPAPAALKPLEPGVPALPEPAASPVASVMPMPPAISLAAMAAAVAVGPLPPVAPQAPNAASGSQNSESTVWVMSSDRAHEPFVIAAGGSYTGVFNRSITIGDSGESAELGHAKALRAKIGGDFIWFEHDGNGYVIRDRATIDRALELYKPMHELSAQQDELGKLQDELGKQQHELSDQMEEVKVRIPDLTEELDKIKERMHELSANGGTQSEIGELQSELGELQSRIGEIQSQAGREQSKIGRQQGELGRKQGELGRKQGEIGQQQGELGKKALQQMTSILDEARAKGLAQPE
jgi:beta-lactamase regulating signal transducer with metallopeptidase domain